MADAEKSKFKILFCDDDAPFASNLIDILSRKLALRLQLTPQDVEFTLVHSLDELKRFPADPKKLKKFDLVFCDLGWAGLTLMGVQLLHDIQLVHPEIYTVLYTAQEESAAVNQALSWQLEFIDTIIRIDGLGHVEKMISVIQECLEKKSGKRKIEGPYTDEKFKELIQNHSLFPRVEESALLALNKARYLSFIKEKYGGFPQMARERALDLNNIYRANRRFKNVPFVVFQLSTIREIVGVVDQQESAAVIKELLTEMKI